MKELHRSEIQKLSFEQIKTKYLKQSVLLKKLELASDKVKMNQVEILIAYKNKKHEVK